MRIPWLVLSSSNALFPFSDVSKSHFACVSKCGCNGYRSVTFHTATTYSYTCLHIWFWYTQTKPKGAMILIFVIYCGQYSHRSAIHLRPDNRECMYSDNNMSRERIGFVYTLSLAVALFTNADNALSSPLSVCVCLRPRINITFTHIGWHTCRRYKYIFIYGWRTRSSTLHK